MATSDDDRPLTTQTAAPPTVPPKRPIVGLALADEGWRERFQEQQKQLADLIAQADAMLRTHEAWFSQNRWTSGRGGRDA